MRAKRIVLLSNRSLLASGVQRLLQEVDGLELSTVAADDPEVASKLRGLDPGVIVLDSGDASLGEGVITQMLGEHPKARVIAVHLNRASIEVYRMQRLLETNLQGLLEAIEGKGASPTRGVARKREPSKVERETNGGETMGP